MQFLGNGLLRHIIRSGFPWIKLLKDFARHFIGFVAKKAAFRSYRATLGERRRLGYNPRFDFSLRKEENMEAERINSLSALLSDLTAREAELRRYL